MVVTDRKNAETLFSEKFVYQWHTQAEGNKMLRDVKKRRESLNRQFGLYDSERAAVKRKQGLEALEELMAEATVLKVYIHTEQTEKPKKDVRKQNIIRRLRGLDLETLQEIEMFYLWDTYRD